MAGEDVIELLYIVLLSQTYKGEKFSAQLYFFGKGDTMPAIMDLSKNAITALFGMWRRGFNDPHDPPKIWELSDRKITVVFGETPCLVIKMIEPTDKKGIWSIEFHFLVKDSPTAEDSRQDAVIVVDHRLGEKPKRYINYRNWAKIIRPDTEESFKKIKSMTEECNELQAA